MKFVGFLFHIKNTHREKVAVPKTQENTYETYEYWLNPLFIRDSYIFFKKKRAGGRKTLFFVIGSFYILNIVLTLAFDRAVLHRNAAFSIVVLSAQ